MIFVFPGQGSQKIGMGKDIYDAFSSAKDVFHEVDDAISLGLSELIFSGKEEELKLTENTQPALMAVSMAFIKVLEQDFDVNISEKAKFFAGHSLGEYTALCAGGALSIKDTAKILRARGAAMANAFPNGGAMAAILGLNIEVIEEIIAELCDRENFVQIANDNCDGQIVISGHKPAVEKVMEKANAANAKKTVLLEVSGPFHSVLMKNAVDPLSDILDSFEFAEPSRPIISNVTAKAEDGDFKKLLVKQLVSSVRWRESMMFAALNHVTKCVEIGNGKVLTGLAKRISTDMETININSLESLEIFCKGFYNTASHY